jgi:hypothetical protein
MTSVPVNLKLGRIIRRAASLKEGTKRRKSMQTAREAEEGRNTSALAQPRSRTVQPIPALASPAWIPKKFPDRTTPHPRRRSFSLPTANSQPPTALTLLRLRRGNMPALEIKIPLQRALRGPRAPPTSSLTASPSLCRAQLCLPSVRL